MKEEELDSLLDTDISLADAYKKRDEFNNHGKSLLVQLLSQHNIAKEDIKSIFNAINMYYVKPAIFLERIKLEHMLDNARGDLYSKSLSPENILIRMDMYQRFFMDEKPKNIVGYERGQMQAMFNDGWTISQLAKIFERSKSSVHAVVHSKT
ncbi:hypothetical protein C5S31_03340 [ANME-1 cluster archaeon GoMg2]|nr:hypothetical protein [ANME-1 cluster archaeon GoMg2]